MTMLRPTPLTRPSRAALRALAGPAALAAALATPAALAATAAALAAAVVPATAHAQQPVPLDTVRVMVGSRLVAGAAAATRGVDVIERTALEALPARTLTDVLARALGVDLLARSGAQADLSIRGSSFEQVLVMVDGVAVNDDQTGHFHLDQAIPLDAIERIEVLRGPASALYGSAAIGGVVNIVTRRDRTALTARTQLGSFGAAAVGAEAALARGGYDVRISADHDRSDGHRPGTDHDITQVRLATDAPLAGGTIGADVAYAARNFGADGFYAPFNAYEETRTRTAVLRWRGAAGPLIVEPRVSYRSHDDDFILRRDDPAFYRNIHESQQAGGEIVARWTPSAVVRLAAGAEGARSTLRSGALGDRHEHRAALFGEVAAGDASGRLLTLGVRADRHSAFGTFVSPSLAAGWRVAPAVQLRLSGSAGYRAPSWTERYYRDPVNIATPDLGIERFRTAEAGIELARHATRLELSAFLRRATDLIDWARPVSDGDGPWRTLNVERATFRGAEAALYTRIGALGLTGRAALLRFDATATAGMTSKYALRPLTESFSVEALAPLPAALSLAARAAHHRRAGGVAWQVADLRLARASRGAQVFLDVTNIADARFVDIAGQPAPGRAFSVGARLRR
jgi:vitamin B12 transporter